MSNVNYTEIVFKIKEEHIKFMKANEDGFVLFTSHFRCQWLNRYVHIVEPLLESQKANVLEILSLVLCSILE